MLPPPVSLDNLLRGRCWLKSTTQPAEAQLALPLLLVTMTGLPFYDPVRGNCRTQSDTDPLSRLPLCHRGDDGRRHKPQGLPLPVVCHLVHRRAAGGALASTPFPLRRPSLSRSQGQRERPAPGRVQIVTARLKALDPLFQFHGFGCAWQVSRRRPFKGRAALHEVAVLARRSTHIHRSARFH